jgi:hypothetical protein
VLLYWVQQLGKEQQTFTARVDRSDVPPIEYDLLFKHAFGAFRLVSGERVHSKITAHRRAVSHASLLNQSH